MPVIKPAANRYDPIGEQVAQAIWEKLGAADVGEGFFVGGSAERCVQAVGDFDGEVRLEGSNDGQHWDPVHDPQGIAVTFIRPGMRSIGDSPLHIRPAVTRGTVNTSITVILVVRKK